MNSNSSTGHQGLIVFILIFHILTVCISTARDDVLVSRQVMNDAGTKKAISK